MCCKNCSGLMITHAHVHANRGFLLGYGTANSCQQIFELFLYRQQSYILSLTQTHTDPSPFPLVALPDSMFDWLFVSGALLLSPFLYSLAACCMVHYPACIHHLSQLASRQTDVYELSEVELRPAGLLGLAPGSTPWRPNIISEHCYVSS